MPSTRSYKKKSTQKSTNKYRKTISFNATVYENARKKVEFKTKDGKHVTFKANVKVPVKKRITFLVRRKKE